MKYVCNSERVFINFQCNLVIKIRGNDFLDILLENYAIRVLFVPNHIKAIHFTVVLWILVQRSNHLFSLRLSNAYKIVFDCKNT